MTALERLDLAPTREAMRPRRFRRFRNDTPTKHPRMIRRTTVTTRTVSHPALQAVA